MYTPIETVRGSHYEMGRQFGQLFRHVIHADIHQWAMRHDFQGSDAYLDECISRARNANAAIAPWIDDELHGMAEGSGAELAWLHRLNLRVWSAPLQPFDPSLPPPSGLTHGGYRHQEGCGCTAIGMVSSEEGVVIGGNLDDSRAPYVLVRRIPKDGLAHVTIARSGGIWNQNGMNEAGLFMAANGMGAHPDFKDPNPAPLPPNGTINRMVLETCRSVPEAVQFIINSRTSHSYLLGDAQGRLAAVQIMGSLHDVQYAADHQNMVFCTNHPFMSGIVEPLRAQNCKLSPAEKSIVRFEVLARARRELPRSSDSLRGLLCSHEGFPNSICNNLSAFALYACPQKDKSTCFFADSPPCRNAFTALKIVTDQ